MFILQPKPHSFMGEKHNFFGLNLFLEIEIGYQVSEAKTETSNDASEMDKYLVDNCKN